MTWDASTVDVGSATSLYFVEWFKDGLWTFVGSSSTLSFTLS